MKILMVNKYYWEKAGTERYMFSLIKLLTEAGHEVIPFSMDHPQNYPTPWTEYFVPFMDYDNPNLVQKLLYASRAMYYPTARRRLSRLLEQTPLDLAHIHNLYHQLSPSVIFELKKRGIPIIMTVHDLKPICPNYRMLNGRGKICTDCLGGRFYWAVLNRCVKKSYLASIICALELYLHTFQKVYHKVDRLITPSAFYRDMLIKAGFSPAKVIHLPNVIPTEGFSFHPEYRPYILYAGRLSPEKGLWTLMKAYSQLKIEEKIDWDLLLAGAGEMRDALARWVSEQGLVGVKFLGHLTVDELREVIKWAGVVVIPSEWYENSPISVLEAFGYGKPVIAANIGGLPEMIEDGYNGKLFSPGSTKELKESIHFMIINEDRLKTMAKQAYQTFCRINDTKKHLSFLTNLYKIIRNEAKTVPNNTGGNGKC